MSLRANVAQRTAELQDEIARREQLEKELLETADKERERIGRDLHDGLGQHLTAVAAASASLERNLAKQTEAYDEAKKITRMANKAIADARLLVKGLYPAALELGGLSSALEQLCSGVRTTFGVDCLLVCQQSIVIEDRNVAAQLFRIAQEAINNAIKHAHPKKVMVALTAQKEDMILIVKDDGAGFSAPSSLSDGMGLHVMSYRAKLIGASLAVEQDPEGGTLVTCTISRSASWQIQDHSCYAPSIRA